MSRQDSRRVIDAALEEMYLDREDQLTAWEREEEEMRVAVAATDAFDAAHEDESWYWATIAHDEENLIQEGQSDEEDDLYQPRWLDGAGPNGPRPHSGR